MKQFRLHHLFTVFFGLFVVLFGISSASAAELNVHIDDLVISPDGDGNRDQTNISFKLPTSGRVRIQIFQILTKGVKAGEKVYILVKNITPGRLEAGPQFIVWNGTNDSGKVVQNGSYQARVNLYADDGSELSGKSVALLVEVVPVFTDVKFTPDPFVPGEKKATIEFMQTKQAYVVIRIFGPEGAEVFRKGLGSSKPKRHFIDWDGKNRKTKDFVSTPGEYRVILGAKTTDNQRIVERTTFLVTPSLKVSTVSATPRIFDPKDKGGTFATRISFEADKPNVDYSVIIQDQSGATVWSHQFKYVDDPPDAGSSRKTFTWGGLRGYVVSGHYILKRVEKTVIGKGDNNIVEKVLADKIRIDNINLYLRNLKDVSYDRNGVITKKAVFKTLRRKKLIYTIGEKYQHKGAWWDIEYVRLKREEILLPNGNYSVRIKVRDLRNQNVSAEFGTVVTIFSRTDFALCLSDFKVGKEDSFDAGEAAGGAMEDRDDFSGYKRTLNNLSDVKRSIPIAFKELMQQNKPNICDPEDRDYNEVTLLVLEGGTYTLKQSTLLEVRKILPVSFVIRGGTLKRRDMFDVNVFDPHSLSWLTVDKIEDYWVFDSDVLKVYFKVTKDARITAQVRSMKGGIIRSLPPKPAHLFTDIEGSFFQWDGMDEDGDFVPSGIYLLDITATDADPDSPKTITTTAIIALKDIRRQVTLDTKESKFQKVVSATGGSRNVVDFYAFPEVTPFSELVYEGSGLDELLNSAKSSKYQEKKNEKGNFYLVFKNKRGEDFKVEYIFADLEEDISSGGDGKSEDEKIFKYRIIDIKSQESTDIGRDVRRVMITDGFGEVNATGLFDLWVFAHKEGECRLRKQSMAGRADALYKCYKQKRKMTVMNIKARGLGRLTESGVHLRDVVSQGFDAIANSIN